MKRCDLEAALAQADAAGWKYITTASGERVQVMHILNRSYDTVGECGEDGVWHCANGFILPNGLFTFDPTHWRAAAVEDACGEQARSS